MWERVGWGCWYNIMGVVTDFLDDGVVSPIGLFFIIYIVFRIRW